MRLFVHAANLVTGGGFAVGYNFLREAERLGAFDIEAVVPQNIGYEQLESASLQLVRLPKVARSALVRSIVERTYLARKMEAFKADAVFSMGNIALPVERPQLLLLQSAFPVYPNSPVWKLFSPMEHAREKFRLVAFRERLRYATAVAVQTETIKARFRQHYGAEPPIYVVPNAVPEAFTELGQSQAAHRKKTDNRYTFLSFARYYGHKNLESLLAIGSLIRDQALPFRIVITVSAKHGQRASRFLREIERRDLTDIVVNTGPVLRSQIPDLYRKSDALLLPTLLESFSGTYVEAMAFRIPILTSNRDFARDVCGDAAVYFDPLDPHSILGAMKNVAGSTSLSSTLIERGVERLNRMPHWETVARRYLEILDELSRK